MRVSGIWSSLRLDLFYVRQNAMKGKIYVRQKKIGRPVTVDGDRTVTIRLPAEQLDAIDAWAAGNTVPRSEAIRRLVEFGLAAAAKRTRKPKTD